VGASISDSEVEGEIPSSTCEEFVICNPADPVCSPACDDQDYCGHDCLCHSPTDPLPDFVFLLEDLQNFVHFETKDFTPSSCAIVEQCVGGPGLRKLMRFTTTSVNQGQAAFEPPPPKTRPDLFMWGECHQHYHFMSFAQYTLKSEDCLTDVMYGHKYAYCMEDTVRVQDGAEISCDTSFDCSAQGIFVGWADTYTYDLDCSWLDVTDIPPGRYVLEVVINPAKIFHEVTYTNNFGRIFVDIPAVFPTNLTPQTPIAEEPACPAAAAAEGITICNCKEDHPQCQQNH
jgi:hypothetical protein